MLKTLNCQIQCVNFDWILSQRKSTYKRFLCQLEKCIFYMLNEAIEFVLIALSLGEIVQSVRHLSSKREALSSIPGGDVMRL